MKNKITFSILAALGLLVTTATLVWAWPNQPPDKVLISGPGLARQVEIKDVRDRAIFQLGYLEDLKSSATKPMETTAGFQIVRFFYDGQFDFARLTYFPNPNGERGYLYFEDGPMLEGDHTPYHQTWLYTTIEGERELRGLLIRLGAKIDTPESAAVISREDKAVNPGQAPSPSTPTLNSADTLAWVVGALIVGAIGGVGVTELIHRSRRDAHPQ